MATLVTKLTLQSSDTLSDPLNLTCSDTLSVTNPTELSRVSISHSGVTTLIAIDAESYGGACVVEYGYWSI